MGIFTPLVSFLRGSGQGSLQTIFESAGFKVNNTLWDFYNSDETKNYGLGPGSIGFWRSGRFYD